MGLVEGSYRSDKIAGIQDDVDPVPAGIDYRLGPGGHQVLNRLELLNARHLAASRGSAFSAGEVADALSLASSWATP